LATTTTILTASRDGDISGNHPNRNRGALDSMEVARPVRSLVGFEQAAIAAAVGSGTLRQAMLRLTIGLNEDNWGPQGRTVGVHRMRREWTEAGVTWQCADDAAPTNHQQDCDAGATWDMTAPDPALWKGTPTDSRLVTNGLRGVMEFDVTADVAAYLAGAANDGWIVRKADEEGRGRISFLTRESSAGPELVLKVEGTVADTSRPPVPQQSGLPELPEVVLHKPGLVDVGYYPGYVGVQFDSTTAGSTIVAVLARHNLSIIGGWGGLAGMVVYHVRLPQPATSWNELDSIVQRIQAEPGVVNAFQLEHGITSLEQRGRWPLDSLVSPDRASWFVTGSGSQGNQQSIAALRAVRAPLAWGCETGQYGGVLPTLSMIDVFFDATSSDLSVAKRILPTNVRPLQAVATASRRQHGIAVAGVAAAMGDNGVGISGMAWGAPLHLHAYATNGSEAADLIEPFREFLIDAIQSPVHLLVLTSAFGDSSQTALVGPLSQALEIYLRNSPKNVIVYALPEAATGQVGFTTPLSEVAAGRPQRGKALDVAIARVAQGPLGDRVLLVTGSVASTGLRWGPADLWSGGGKVVAAPSDGILSLVGGLAGAPFAGTSFAAPMVAGTAALLWAMAPDLTGAEVVRLIFEGAAEAHTDPLTGVTSPRPDIGVPGVYQLDAYAALKRLARERRDTPICGFPVVTRAVPDPETGATLTSVVLSRPGQGDQEVFRGAVANVAVAQGGRRIGIDGFGTAREVEFRNGSWQATPVRAARYDAWRQFLERDTAFISTFADASTGPSVRVEGASGSRGPLSPCVGFGAFVPGSVWRCSLGAIASSGVARVDLTTGDAQFINDDTLSYNSWPSMRR